MMTLYSNSTCPFCQRCRIVLFEKGMDFEIKPVDLQTRSEDIQKVVGDSELPLLIERELRLVNANIINEYIDERFPHPQLMPPEPSKRAKARLLLHEFEQEFTPSMRIIEQKLTGKEVPQRALDKAKTTIRDNLTQLAYYFTSQKFALDDEFSMVDVVFATLLWRLEYYGIKLPEQGTPLLKYAERIFSRQGFIDALTPAEKAMRK